MYPATMTDKELADKITDLEVRVEYLESGLSRRPQEIVEAELRALFMALSDLYEEKSNRKAK